MIKTTKYIVLFLLMTFISCSKKENIISYVPVKETTDTYDLEGNETMVIRNIPMQHKTFINTVTNDSVNIIHHLDNTNFHFYNDIAFKNKKEGVIVGGAGLRIRTTTDGGKHWQENRFSKFANALHAVAITKKDVYVVGESKYIYRSTDFGKRWSVFDTKELIHNKNSFDSPKYYKIKFYNNVLGLISGIYQSKPILLETTDGGKQWKKLNLHGFNLDESGISDIKILSDMHFIVVTLSGSCYQSVDGGEKWTLLFNNKNISLNATDFLNKNEGYIGGFGSSLFYTKDGGKNWQNIDLAIHNQYFKKNKNLINITNIRYINNSLIITIASTQELEKEFIFKLKKDQKLHPLLSRNNSVIYFKGESYGMFYQQNNMYVLDRNNIYMFHIQSIKINNELPRGRAIEVSSEKNIFRLMKT